MTGDGFDHYADRPLSAMLRPMQEDIGGLNPWPSHIDAVGAVNDPPILAATIVSATLLVLVSAGYVRLWSRLSKARAWRVIQVALLVCLGCVMYLAAGVFQVWLGHIFYRRYFHTHPSTTLGLYVPVMPVYFVGIAYLVIRGLRLLHSKRHRADAPDLPSR